MSLFNPGDSVLINSGLAATIVTYDENADIVVFESRPHGGGVDRQTGHISNTRIEALGAITVQQVQDAKPRSTNRNAVTNATETEPPSPLDESEATDG